MIRVMYKNLDHSDFVDNIVTERIQHVVDKFPEVKGATASVTVSKETSKTHIGPDIFQVKLILTHRGMKPVILQKENGNLYHATAVLADRLFESLHRHVERRRDFHRAERRMTRWNYSGLTAETQTADYQAVG